MILAVLQARTESHRLLGKVLKKILGRPMLSLQIERIQHSKRIEKLVVATSTESGDNGIETLCNDMQISCFRGSLKDVLDRFYQAAVPYRPEHVVRLTGDCPLTDPEIIDDVIDFYIKGGFDFVSNALEPTLPDGLDVEVFTFKALEAAWKEAVLPSHHEHVTPFIHENPGRFKIGHYKNTENLSRLRWTVDYPEDFEFVRQIYEALYPGNSGFTTQDILALLDKDPSLSEINIHFERNEGAKRAYEEDRLFLEQKISESRRKEQ